MKSFAIYYKTRPKTDLNGQSLSSVDLSSVENDSSTDVGEFHVNVWKVNKGNLRLSPVFYVDLGIKISSRCDKVRLFVPFVTKKAKCEDLCKRIIDNRELMCAIFNDEMLPSPQNNTCFCKVTSQTNENSFFLYQLASDNIEFEDFTDDDNQVGTYITITIKGDPANEEENSNSYLDQQLYLRLRLFVENNSEFAITEHVSNDLLQAAFSQTDLFDFRFNEKREIDGKVLEKMKADLFKPMTFDKIHVFYIADTREDVENESSLKIDSRLLEKKHWKTYEPENKLSNTHYVAHHWKKCRKEDAKSFSDASVFFSTKYPNIDLFRLLSYFSVVIMLGWIGSMLSFHLVEISSWIGWVKPVVVIILVTFVVGLVIRVNVGLNGPKFFRKR